MTPLTDPDGDKLIFNWKYEGFPNIVVQTRKSESACYEHSKAVMGELWPRLDNSAPRVQNTVTGLGGRRSHGGKMETESKMSWYS